VVPVASDYELVDFGMLGTGVEVCGEDVLVPIVGGVPVGDDLIKHAIDILLTGRGELVVFGRGSLALGGSRHDCW